MSKELGDNFCKVCRAGQWWQKLYFVSDTRPLFLFGVTYDVLVGAGSFVELSKLVVHYGPWSVFQYYNFTTNTPTSGHHIFAFSKL